MALPDQRRNGDQVPVDFLTVRELLGQEAMRGARLIAGADGLGRVIRRLNVMAVPDIVRWTKQEEFLLATGYPLPRDPGEFARLVGRLAAGGLAGLGIKPDEYLSEVPAEVIAVADAASFPVVIIPRTAPLDDVLSQAFENIVNRQTAALAKRQEIHQALLWVALTGGGLAELVGELAVILPGADIVICDTAGRPLAATPGPDLLTERGWRDATGQIDTSRLGASAEQDEESGIRTAVGVIRAGAMEHGYVVAAGDSASLPAVVAGLAVEQAALVAALEITHDLAVLAVEQQFASNVLHDLVTGSAAGLDDAVARAARFGWDLERPLAVLIAQAADGTHGSAGIAGNREPAAVRSLEAWTSAIRRRDAGAAVAGFATELVAVVGAADPVALARQVQADLAAATRVCYSLGVSQIAAGPASIPALHEEARVALNAGRRLGGPGAVTGFGGLGLFRLLASIGPADLRAFVQGTLGPVLDLSEPARSDLLKTLAVLIENRFNVAESARILHYHYNTMRYRVRKLERLLGAVPDDAQAMLSIAVALQVLRMHEIWGDSRLA